MVYYNKDLFAAQRHRRCRRRSTSSPRRWTPSSRPASPRCAWPAPSTRPASSLYQLALTKADRSCVDDYQLYKNPVDFQADPLKYGAETFADWVKKGYIAQELRRPQGRGHGHRASSAASAR